jgi:nucleoside 2-deoxyribosyltransferase
MKVYLAGPDVFLPDVKRIGKLKQDICKRYGLEGLFPLESELPDAGDAQLSKRIFRANTAFMDGADAIIANLTPFRGPSADAGTVYELGYMLGKGDRLCLGYSNVAGSYLDKVRERIKVRAEGTELFDPDGLIVEDFGLSDNLMIIHGLELCGHSLVVPPQPVADPLRDLTAFEACVRIAAEQKARS